MAQQAQPILSPRETISKGVNNIVAAAKTGELKIDRGASVRPIPRAPIAPAGGGSTPPGDPLVVKQAPTPEDQNQTPPPVAANEPTAAEPETVEKEVSVDEMDTLRGKDPKELSVDELNKLIGAENDPEKAETWKSLLGSKTAPQAAKVHRENEDPDDPEPEEDKFDIQQGDFIEFLMKDIVLASAAWAGKKASGYAGLYAYRGLSWAYHKVDDKAWTPAKEAVMDAWDKAGERIKNIAKTSGEYKHNPDSLGKDSTSLAAKEVTTIHNTKIDSINAQLAKKDKAMDNLAAAVLGEKDPTFNTQKGKTVWQDPKTGLIIPVDTPFMKNILNHAEIVRKGIKESGRSAADQKAVLDVAQKDLSTIIKEHLALEAQAQIFTNNMASAAMLHDLGTGAKAYEADKDKKGIENADKKQIEEDYTTCKNDYLKLFYAEFAKAPVQERDQLITRLLKESSQANDTAFTNIEKGKHKQKDKVLVNETLDRMTARKDGTSIDDEKLLSIQKAAISSSKESASFDGLVTQVSRSIQDNKRQQVEHERQKSERNKQARPGADKPRAGATPPVRFGERNNTK